MSKSFATRITLMSIALMGLTVACGSSEEQTPAPTVSPTPVDLVGDLPAPPEGALEFYSPEWVIPAKSEKQFCYVTQYTGDDIGITSAYHYQSDYGHHVLFMSTTLDADEYPVGTEFDCTGAQNNMMADLLPIYLTILDGNQSYLVLPEDMGVKLRKNTRVVIQSHYLNTSDTPIRVKDAIYMVTKPVDDVTTWAAPFGFSPINFVLPPNQRTEYTLDCPWDKNVNVLFTYGHMHEWGTAISLDHVKADDTTRLYDILEWDVDYRDRPLVEDYGFPGLPVSIGDRFVTRCEWFNDTDSEMRFPQEMCASAGMIYPATVPEICSD